ncbi:hypothetical protein LRS03_07490 [Rhizobacter sp. J219]|uniref:hypothetical protein n=1 Tax=Rhizobacter sp. J219 TaxID=2898430 RepID=UPI002150B01E|nr:hypothetical protein [Rhizobacter sp. J219]MCR5882705.1 hypothetical protein [Rhizobacter sp. J219]
MSNLHVTPFLRNVLRADAAVSAGAALVMLLGGSALQTLLQLPAWLMLGGGAALVAYVVFVAWMSRRDSVPRALVWTLVAINVGWAFDCALLAFASWLQPSAWGQAFLGVHIVTVLVFAELQYVALQRARASGAYAHA